MLLLRLVPESQVRWPSDELRLEPEFWQGLDWLRGSRYRCFWAIVAAIAV
jgi:hypothetical protein